DNCPSPMPNRSRRLRSVIIGRLSPRLLGSTLSQASRPPRGMADRQPSAGGTEMCRTILLAYDGSQAGRDALKQGAELARRCGAKVYLRALLAPGLGVLLAEPAGGWVMTDPIQTDVEEALAEGADVL